MSLLPTLILCNPNSRAHIQKALPPVKRNLKNNGLEYHSDQTKGVEVKGDRLSQQGARAGFAFGIEITVSALR